MGEESRKKYDLNIFNGQRTMLDEYHLVFQETRYRLVGNIAVLQWPNSLGGMQKSPSVGDGRVQSHLDE